MFHDYDAQRPFDRAPTYGVRCAKSITTPPPAMMAPIEPISRDYRTEAPVSDEAFAIYRQSIYGYSPQPLDPRIESVDETPQHWRVERVNYAAAYGNERVPALLFLPKNQKGPYLGVPTLMVNGRHDYFFPVETSQRPMFDRLGLPRSDRDHRIFESGHLPTERQEFIKAILDWLDKYLGPVN